MRLIDADVIIKALDDALDEAREDGANLMDVLKMELFKNFIKQIISHTPSIDAELIRHGHWVHESLVSTNGGSYAIVRCSICKSQFPMWETNYCPTCEAKMDANAEIDGKALKALE